MSAVLDRLDRAHLRVCTRSARFEGPFERLRGARFGYSSLHRFIIDQALSGDEAAVAAWADHIDEQWFRHRASDKAPRDLLRAYVLARMEEYERYRAAKYPWEVRDFQRLGWETEDPDITDILDTLVDRWLGPIGFEVETRRVTALSWKCKAKGANPPLEILFSRTPMSRTNMGADLRLTRERFTTTLGDPFFFSGTHIRCSINDDLGSQLDGILEEYSNVLPYFLEAWREECK